jgi:AraC-like DNA-binding protein
MYLESKRLAHSQILLKEGKSVLDACMESGFSDYSNYIRLFKRRFMITPKQYKDSK